MTQNAMSDIEVHVTIGFLIVDLQSSLGYCPQKTDFEVISHIYI